MNNAIQFERNSDLRVKLLDSTMWKRLEAVANLMEDVCNILDQSEDPNLPLSASLATFWRLKEVNNQHFVN
jgi:hypothetical protein